MKIAIISAARTRSTLVTDHVRIRYPNVTCLHEYYTHQLKTKLHTLPELTDNLPFNEDFIIKIMGHNLKDYDPKILNLEKYDKIYLCERRDFFDQACSLHVCTSTGVWIQRRKLTDVESNSENYTTIKTQSFNIGVQTIQQQANDIACYLNIKHYLISNKIKFDIELYDTPRTNAVMPSNYVLIDPKLNYSELIFNYTIKDQVNTIFNQYFDYETCQHDIANFNLALLKLTF